MPSAEEHLDWATRNQQLAKNLEATGKQFPQWAVIAIFFSALHLLEAYLAGMGEHPRGHDERLRAFEDHSILTPIWEDYRTLKDYSEDARYDCILFDWQQVQEMEQQELQRIEAAIRRLLP